MCLRCPPPTYPSAATFFYKSRALVQNPCAPFGQNLLEKYMESELSPSVARALVHCTTMYTWENVPALRYTVWKGNWQKTLGVWFMSILFYLILLFSELPFLPILRGPIAVCAVHCCAWCLNKASVIGRMKSQICQTVIGTMENRRIKTKSK